jgi:hypothetical protein
MPMLPTNDANITVSKMIRYNLSTAGTFDITRNDLLNLIVLPSTALIAYGLLKAVKINKISCWSVLSSATFPLGQGSDNTITWLSSLGKERTVRGTQMGIAPSYISSKPPVDSLASFWTNENTTTLTESIVTFDLELGSIIDIHFTMIFCNNSVARSFAITSGTIGRVSYNNMNNLTVQGYNAYTPL